MKTIAILNTLLLMLNFTSAANANDNDSFLSQISKQISGAFSNGGAGKDQETATFGAGAGAGTLLIDKGSDGLYRILYKHKAQESFQEYLKLSNITTVSQFSGQDMKINELKHFTVYDSSGVLQSAGNWFVVQGDNSVHVLLRERENATLLSIPADKNIIVKNASVGAVQINRGYQFLFSYETEKNGGRTYIIDPATGHASIVIEKYVQLRNQTGNTYTFDANTLNLKLAHEPEIKLASIMQQKYTLKINTPIQSTATHQLTTTTGANSGARALTPASVNERTAQSSKESSNGDLKPVMPDTVPTSFNETYEHEGKSYQVKTVSEGTAEERGIYIVRKSDNVRVKMSSLPHLPSVTGPHGGFNFKDGVLSHPNLLRAVDLGRKGDTVDIFEVESKFVPTAENVEAVKWMLESFPDFKTESKKWIAPVTKRNSIAENVNDQLLSGETTAQLIIGDSTDKDLVLAQISKNVPRTWKTLSFDSNRLGDLSMSGQKEQKAANISEAIKSTPIVLFSRNFTNFGGVGVTQGSSTDILQLLANDFTSPDGYLKLVGTTYNVDQIHDRIKDKGVVSSIQAISIPDLTLKETKEHLQTYIKQNYPKVSIDSDTLEYLIDKGNSVRRVDAEPKRSEEFIKSISRKIKSGQVTAEEIDRAVTYHFGISEGLATSKGQISTIKGFPEQMKKHVAGHGHLVKEIGDGAQIGLSGQGPDRGAMQMLWVEGPPGVGKTELAKATAKSLNVPLGYIDMNQFKRNSGNSSADLLAQIAKYMNKNPYSVVLLDEVEKADFKILEGLLMALSNEYFEYLEDSGGGRKEARRQSLNNATVMLTSNGIGHLVLEWYYAKIEADPKYDNVSSEVLNEEFLKFTTKEEIIRMLGTAGVLPNIPDGLPPPLLDRIDLHIAFPASFDAMVGLFYIKLKEIKAKALSKNGIRITLESEGKNEDTIIREIVATARKEKKSVRNTIKAFDRAVNLAISEIRMNDLETMKSNRYYSVDPNNRRFRTQVKNAQCVRVYESSMTP